MMLYLRILSALVGIPVVLGAVYYGGPWYASLLLLVANLGLFEYVTMLKRKGLNLSMMVALPGVTLMMVIIYLGYFNLIYPLIMVLFIFLFTGAIFQMERQSIAEASMTMWGIIYIGGLCGYMLLLRQLPGGALFTFMFIIGVWIHDSAAYFIGLRWGLRRFAPEISPNKSAEGSAAGIITAVLLFFSLAILIPEEIPLKPVEAIVFGLGLAVFAQLGDLLESALKRQYAVKDSGALIPGHGGVLDRFDSLMLTAPFAYYFFILI